MEIDYLKIVEKSIKFSWNNKGLWVLGFLIALFGGGTNISSNSSRSSSDISNFNLNFLENNWVVLLLIFGGILSIFLIIGIILWYVKSRANAGLLQACNDEMLDKKVLSYKEYWQSGNSYVKEIMIADIIFFLIIIVASFISVILGYLLTVPIINLFFIPVFIIWIFIFIFGVIIASVLYKFVYMNIVVKRLKYIEAIKESWELFRKCYINIGLGFLAFILTVIAYYSIYVIVVFIVSLFTIVPIIGLIFVVLITGNNTLAIFFGIILLFWGIILKLMLSVIESPFKVFENSYWCRIFKEISLK